LALLESNHRGNRPIGWTNEGDGATCPLLLGNIWTSERSACQKNSSINRAVGTQNKNALITGKSYSERFKCVYNGKYTHK